MYRPNLLKQKLMAGHRVLGCWTALGSPVVTELLAMTGFDYLLLDQEHGLGDLDSLVAQMQAMSATACSPIVRVPWNDHAIIKRVLDAGAEGIMIPAIETAEEAKAAVAACHYPPKGIRGAGASMARASNYGMVTDYAKTAGDDLMIILQVESPTAIANLDAILAVEGIDLVFIGPGDLAAAAGHMGNMRHPDVVALIEEGERKILAAGKPMGTVPHPGRSLDEMFSRGYTFINAGSDVSRLRDSALADIRSFRSASGA